MTDGYLMDAECVHGVIWWDCDECDDNFIDLNADVIEPALRDGNEGAPCAECATFQHDVSYHDGKSLTE